MDQSYLDWPFLGPEHKALALSLGEWVEDALCDEHAIGATDHAALDARCRSLLNTLGQNGWLEYTAPGPGKPALDRRSLCLIRETLAYGDGLADFVFAMQGLGAGAISLFGTDAQKAEWLPRTRRGEAIAAFALTETKSGSDVANLDTHAKATEDGWVINGEKTWISNGGIADFYTLFARTGEAPGARGISAFIVPADTPGLTIAKRLDATAPHPLAQLTFENMHIKRDALLGKPGDGFKMAMTVLDSFRPTVGAAALGFARRALDETLERAGSRQLFGGLLRDLQMVQGHIADMAVDIDQAALLVYRAAWSADTHSGRNTRQAAMAKLVATEAAQRVVDTAVQLHGGDGVRYGHILEQLYREVRALRIYEGASDVQKLVIARQTLDAG